MPKDFEKVSKSALDAERQWKENMERTSQVIRSAEFYDTSASVLSDFEKLGAMSHAQNQAQLDVAATLKEIRDTQEAERKARIDAERRAEIANRKQTTENRMWQVLSVTIGLLTLGATVLFGILGLLR